MDNWSLLNQLKGHIFGIRVLTFSFDGKTLASGSGENTIKIWDLEKKTQIKELKGHQY